MAGTVRDVIEIIRTTSKDQVEIGRRFERLMLTVFRTDPQWTAQFSEVWLWADSPLAKKNSIDIGIDLVARDAATGGLCAIQCKCYAPDKTIRKSDIDSFFTASGKTGITRRIIVATTDRWGPNAEAALTGQQIPVTRIGLSDLDASPIDWAAIAADDGRTDGEALDERRLHDKKTSLPHQEEAIDAVLTGFESHDRGKLIMACGTGKTFTSLKVAERIAADRADQGHNRTSILILVPSIALLSQTIREWTREAELPLRPFAVCSDTKVSKRVGPTDTGDLAVHDLALPATTSATTLLTRIGDTGDRPGLTVVFSTYQSLRAITDAQTAGLDPFDLVICDEAHRTTGVLAAGRAETHFTRVHDSGYIIAERRLYMTATPRIYTEPAKDDAKRASVELCSMDDETRFGPEFYRLGFGAAVEAGLLADYRVMVLSVDTGYAAGSLQPHLADQNTEINVSDAAKIIGCWNGLAKHVGTSIQKSGFDPGEPPMKRAVAFSQSIEASKRLAEAFLRVVDGIGHAGRPRLHCEVRHVDGTMNALERNEALDWLKSEPEEGHARILTNARCLSEGVDVPALDAVLFLHPRSSKIDIIQAVGRVMRKSPGKDYGYIILPVAVPEGVPPETALADNERYRAVWQVLNALRSHDERFNAHINSLGLNKSKSDRIFAGHYTSGDGYEDLANIVQDAIDGRPSVDDWREAVYARIVEKVGDRVYWRKWAKTIGDIAGAHVARIRSAVELPGKRAVLEAFVTALRSNLNPSVSEEDALELLAQHLITKPVFDALFADYTFAAHNPVSKAIETVLAELDDQVLDTEREELKRFYEQVRNRLKGIDNHEGRQKVLVEIYEQFFRTAAPPVADRLGIVYTPVEAVDFILQLTDQALRKYLDTSLSGEGVQVIDPFVGTGAFLARFLQSGLIRSEDLFRNYSQELHANELVLLAYYIATVNIEEAFHGRWGGTGYQPFEGMVFTDTFQLYEGPPAVPAGVLAGNTKRAAHQHGADILVVLGNPPYSVGQSNQNDGNQNLKYPGLDRRIRETYAAKSTATNKNSLYDSYIRALRWASDRIKDEGVICFVLNNGFIDGNTAAGLRLTLTEEFDSIYCYNLRGNARSAGEQRKKESGNVFGQSSRAGIAVLLLVKGGAASDGGPCRLHYRDIGDYLTRKQKLALLKNGAELICARGLDALDWQSLEPSPDGDWINLRDKRFQTFRPLGGKAGETERPVFSLHSGGLKTGRDAWAYNFSKDALSDNVRAMIDFYNSRVDLFEAAEGGVRGRNAADAGDGVFETDGRRFSWNVADRSRLLRGERLEFRHDRVFAGTYRPFTKQHVYFTAETSDRIYRLEQAFPSRASGNVGFYTTGTGSEEPFSVLAIDTVPNLHAVGTKSVGPLFARYTYHRKAPGGLLFDDTDEEYERTDNITEAALRDYRETYRDSALSKDDIFYYVYGILHSPMYRSEFEADLKKSLPRIPKAEHFTEFARAGRRLARLHLCYETAEPYQVIEERVEDLRGRSDAEIYRVDRKMRFASKQDRSRIVYNSHITLSGIPEAAHRYRLGSRSALEWIMDRYHVRIDKASGIVNDPNEWSDDPRYIIDLLKRVVTVSLETMKTVDALPPLEILPDQ